MPPSRREEAKRRAPHIAESGGHVSVSVIHSVFIELVISRFTYSSLDLFVSTSLYLHRGVALGQGPTPEAPLPFVYGWNSALGHTRSPRAGGRRGRRGGFGGGDPGVQIQGGQGVLQTLPRRVRLTLAVLEHAELAGHGLHLGAHHA